MKLRVLLTAVVLTCAAAVHAGDEAAAPLPRETSDAAVIRGSIAFKTYCVLCHGTAGKGDGRAARMYTPAPANLTISPFNDKYKEMIIRGGGVSMGRSSFMPPWGDELTEDDVVRVRVRELRARREVA